METATHPRPRRVASPDRWQRALLRALAAELSIYQDTLTGAWMVTSQSRPGVVHTTDGHECSCESWMLAGDPVCAHRALYWHVVQGTLDLDVPTPAPTPLPTGHARLGSLMVA